MSAEFESGFFVREPAWHGMGTVIKDAPDSKTAIKVAGLDWKVLQAPMCAMPDDEDEGFFTDLLCNYRDTDHAILGFVSDRYEIVQNEDAFEFTDSLLDNDDVKYETAGSLQNGKLTWMLARIPSTNILGDAIDKYLLFSNSFDGKRSINVAITPVRVVCNNTLNMALKGAKRKWSFAHKGDIGGKLEEAKQCLLMADKYNKAFDDECIALAKQKLSGNQIKSILDKLFPIKEDGEYTNRKLNNMIIMHENFKKCMEADDLQNFNGTAYKAVNAFSDMIFHGMATMRHTKNEKENNLLSVINGNQLFDKAVTLIKDCA